MVRVSVNTRLHGRERAKLGSYSLRLILIRESSLALDSSVRGRKVTSAMLKTVSTPGKHQRAQKKRSIAGPDRGSMLNHF